MLFSIPFDPSARCLLKKGQKVVLGMPYLETGQDVVKIIAVANKLNIKPHDIFKSLKKFVGDTVEKGDVVALKKGILSSKTLKSEAAGIIREIDHEKGTITLSTSGQDRKITPAFFKGTVEAVYKDKIEINVEKCKQYALKSAPIVFGGEVLYLEGASALTPQMSKKIVVSASFSGYFLAKAEAMDVGGFVTAVSTPTESANRVARLANLKEFNELFKEKYSYCVVVPLYSKIYFYQ